jgi:bis(5'-adenosyl)-triphosphatase
MTASSQSAALSSGDALFGRFLIPNDCIFFRSKYATAFVNLRPIVPGHVLVMSNRCVPRLGELNDEEYVDVWTTVRRVQEILQLQMQQQQRDIDARIDPNQPQESLISFNVAIQDGVAAGQSVPHVHVHILPRVAGDYARNDDIYQDLEHWAPRLVPESQSHTANNAPGGAPPPINVPDVRRDRTVAEMAQEAALYRRIVETSHL